MSHQRRVTLLILDGARPDVLAHLASAGDLPHLSRHVLEPGGAVPATTVFPSTTGVAYLPFLTGCFPGTADVPGIRWMDVARYGGAWVREREHIRSYCSPQASRLNTDLARGVVSLFDLERDAVALCTPFNRGLARGAERVTVTRALLGAQAHYTGWYELLDQAVGHALRRAARERKRLALAVFPGVDGVTHWLDPWHPRVLAVYRRFDRILGDYARAGGLAGDHLALVVSDHGMSPVRRHQDVSLALEAAGVPTMRHPLLWRRHPSAAVMISGNAAAHVYLRPGVRRTFRWPLSAIESGEVPGVPRWIVERLVSLDGVALLAATEGDDVVVLSRDGRARLSVAGPDTVAYVPEVGDPLRIGPGMTLSPAEWLEATLNGPFPDAPVQLLQLFRSARSGDLVLAAAPGADLRADWEIPEHRSGHGSVIADHMRCLVAANRSLAGPLRTVDVFPLILRHLGHATPEGIDGVVPLAGAAVGAR